jgi:hypothetical protein
MEATRNRPAAAADGNAAIPKYTKGKLPVIPVDERAAEVRAIKMG